MINKSVICKRPVLTVLLVVMMVAASSCTGFAGSITDLGSFSGTAETLTASPAQQQVPLPQDGSSYPSQELLATLYDHILPSVVDIEVVTSAPEISSNTPFPFPFGMPDIPQAPGPARGEGSGFIYDSEGHIVTNNHVVDGAEEIIVHFYNGMWAEGELVAGDAQADLAVIKVTFPEELDVAPLSLAAPDSLDEGHWVVAFGTPFGLEGSMTLGIVSAIGRGMPMGDGDGPRYTLPDVIQTDAAINPGNSGGPLLNLDGEVIGVNFAINSPVRANSGVGFAIPANIVSRIVPALIEDGAYRYPYLGISGQTVTPQVATEQDLPDNVLGAWVAEVTDNGPAAEGEVEKGDIIVALNDVPIHRFDDLVSALINTTQPDDEAAITVWRDGEEVELTVVIGERPANTPIADETGTGETIIIGDAIDIARETVSNSGLMEEIDTTSATLQRVDGRSVWEVTLSGEGKTATVLVDAGSGEVIGLNVQ